jgi:putative ABC transport system ATP-binding protein
MSLACEQVTVTYGDGPGRVDAVRDVSLAIGPEEAVALWGPSGSGKTTLLHVLAGLVAPTAGTVTGSAGQTAFVFQGANLLPHFTAEENVAFARRASRAGAAWDLTTAELLEVVGLGAKREAIPADLSGGEAQRVAIARALGQSPTVLLCDEPTGHLDSDTGARVLDLVEACQHEFGFALVIATHDAGVAARCDRVAQLTDGRLVGEEVMA